MISFSDTIALRPATENLWAGDADTDYSHPAGQFGGWTAAALLKAVMMEPGERGLPLSMTVLFPDAVGAGPIEIRTRPLRAGARLQFWRAELAQRDKICAHAQVTFGARREGGTSFTDAKPFFDMAPPDDPRMISFSPPTKFGEQLDGRSLPWPGDYKPSESPAVSVFWARHGKQLAMDHALLTLLADFAPPRPMIKLGRFMLSSTVSMNIYFHASAEEIAAVGPDHVLSETVSRRCHGGFFDHELKLWSRSGALLATSEQVAAFRE